MKAYLRKGIKCNTGRGGRGKEREIGEGTPRPEEEVLHGGADMVCSSWRTHAGAAENHEEEGPSDRNCYVLTNHPSAPLVSCLKGLNVTCCDSRGREVCLEKVKLSLGKGAENCFP